MFIRYYAFPSYQCQLIPDTDKDFPFRHYILTCFGVHLGFYPIGKI